MPSRGTGYFSGIVPCWAYRTGVVSPGKSSDSAFGALAAFLGISCIVGVLLAGVGIPAAGLAASGTKSGVNVFNSLPATLSEQPLAQRSTMLASDGSVIAKFYWEDRIEEPLTKISQTVQDATVATEDYRFFQHGGVDLQGIARAAVHDVLSPDIQGASTLTQQYVKNVLVEQAASNGNPKTAAKRVAEVTDSSGTAGMARKLRQAKLAIALEKKYSKKQILNRYLNINNYGGNPRQYGVEAASRHYWGVHASQLSIPQAALLAGIVKDPSAYNPEAHPKAALDRRDTVLHLMHEHGYITADEYAKAEKSGLDLKIHPSSNGCTTAGISAYFCDYVEESIATSPKFGKTVDDRLALLKRGGLTIKTTLDPKLERSAQHIVSKRVPDNDPHGVGQALTTVQPGTGKVLAMVENRKYSVAAKPKVGYTSVNYNVGSKLHGGGGFQVGSTYKVFTLAAWLKDGHTLHDQVDATRRNYPADTWTYHGCPKNAGAWDPHDAVDGEGTGEMSALTATVKSVNTAFAAMANQINMCDIQGAAKKLGIRWGSGKSLDWKDANGSTPALFPSTVLGTVTTTPLLMSSAYAAFADKGTYCSPVGITAVTDASGKKMPVPSPHCHQAISKKIATGVAWALTQTFNGGTTADLKIGVPAGAKTGTTNFSVGAGWLDGFTKGMSTAVWTGSPTGNDPALGNGRIPVGGHYYGPNYGATISGPTWQSFMKANAKSYKIGKFAKPGKEILGYVAPPAPPTVPENAPEQNTVPSSGSTSPATTPPSAPSTHSSTPSSPPKTSNPPKSPPTHKPAPPTNAPSPPPSHPVHGGNGNGGHGSGHGHGNGGH